MRILFISPFMHRLRRGIERFTVDLAGELTDSGAEVHILAWQDSNNIQWSTAHPAIQWHQLLLTRYFQGFSAGLLYPWFIRQIKPDVLIMSFLWHGEDIALRFMRSSIQTTLVLNYPAAQVRSRYKSMQRKELIDRIDNVVAVSQFVADGAKPYIGNVTAVIPNGVYTDHFRPNSDKTSARQFLKLPKAAHIIGTVAAFEKRKGIQHMIAALPEVLTALPNTHYVVAGDGPERDIMQSQIAALNLEGNVHLLGNIEDVRLVYDSIDMLAFLTTGEACPIALLEAMSSGLPLLLAKQPPLNEFADEYGAIFVNENDSAEVARQTISLLEDQVTRNTMGVYNRRVAVDKYDWSIISKQYLALFTTGPVNYVHLNDTA